MPAIEKPAFPLLDDLFIHEETARIWMCRCYYLEPEERAVLVDHDERTAVHAQLLGEAIEEYLEAGECPDPKCTEGLIYGQDGTGSPVTETCPHESHFVRYDPDNLDRHIPTCPACADFLTGDFDYCSYRCATSTLPVLVIS